MTIGIIGLGYVGLTLAVAAASKGIEVYGVETNHYIKDCIKNGHAHFFEPGLDDIIIRYKDKTLHVVEKFSDTVKYDAFIITVGTPLQKINGKKQEKPNFEYIREALRGTLSDVYDGSQLVVLRSTVSVGTTRKIVLPYLAELCGKSQDDILVSMCPERTLEGTAVYELSNLPQVISGNNEKSIEIARKLFYMITPCVIVAKTLEEAELIKLYCNVYRDMTFAIGNAFCMAAQEFGVDGLSAIEHANYGYTRSNIAKPGFVAGPCLEKDAYILINNMPQCDSKNFILSARKFNESMEDIVVRWVKEKIGEPTKKNIVALSGMAFKGQPETSDLRGSSSVYIAEKLKQAGYKMILHDFVAIKTEMEKLNFGVVYDDFYEASRDARIMLVLNNHRKYGSIQCKKILYSGERRFEILDAWGVCTELYYCEDIKISTLGNMFNSDKLEGK